jgi:hypothetical protein
MNEEERISRQCAKLFGDVKRRFEEISRIPLNVVVCGPGPPTPPDPTHPFHLREAIKNYLRSVGDVSFYIEEWLKTDEGRKALQEIEDNLGYRPDLRDIEFEILQSAETDKDVHLMERPGAILELRDFEESLIICQKLRIFVDRRYKDRDSYVNTLINRLLGKGVKIYWYDDRDDLLEKVKKALIPNRIEKSKIE